MARHIFDPLGDVLLILSTATPEEQTKDTISIGSKGSKESEGPEGLDGSHVEMLVSSRHLMLASPVFKAMLQPHFAEGHSLQLSGHVNIQLFDDNIFALEIGMNIIHCQMKKVPEQLDFTALAYLSTLVDKYQMHALVDYFAQKWIEKLEGPLPTSNKTNLRIWLGISWVFKVPDLFTKTTLLATQCFTDGTYQGETAGYPADLPIPQAVMEKIESERCHGIERALDIIKGAIQKYQDNRRVQCPNSTVSTSAYKFGRAPVNLISERICDCATLGALIKSALAEKLYPFPTYPYNNWSVMRMVDQINAMAVLIPSYCLELNKAKNNQSYHGRVTLERCHNLDESIPLATKQVLETLQGFDIQTFFPNPESTKASS